MKYDFAIIGAGPAGYTFAIRASQFKKKCVIFDESNVGGTCLNVGCIPSKTWVNISNLYDTIKNDSGQIGIDIKDAKLNWEKVQEFRCNVISRLQNGIKTLFKLYDVDYKNTFVIKIEGGKVYYNYNDVPKSIEADKIIIATGNEPVELKEFEHANPSVLTYKNCFQLEKVPQSLLVIGGGIIGIELAQIFMGFGVKVYIVELLDSILSGVDLEVVAKLVGKLKKGKAVIFTSSKVEEVKYTDSTIEVSVRNLKTGQISNVIVEKVIVAVGMRPKDVKGLCDFSLTDKGFVRIDKNFKTSLDNVYAIGDIVGPPFLAHRAFFQGKMLAESLAKKLPVYMTNVIPSVIFTSPEIAFVGLQEQELKDRKIDYITSKFNYLALGRAVVDNKTDGFVKVFTTPDKKEILGVIIYGKNASELVSEYTLAIEAKLSLEDISLVVHPHPTYSELVTESVESGLGYSIHSIPR